MKKSTHLVLGLAVALSAVPGQALSAGAKPLPASSTLPAMIAPQGGSSISGHIFSESHQPLADIYVELQNDTYSTLARAKTNGAGLYSFVGLPDGNFKVKVLPYGTAYAEQMQDVTIYTISLVPGRGRDNQRIDFYLRPKPNASNSPFAPPTGTGTVFVQDVPPEAKKMYEKGVGELEQKKDKEGFESLKRSLEIFPTYYLALERLGTEYVIRGYSEAAGILLTKAVEVNPRGVSGVVALGIAQFNLKQYKEAIATLQRATNLYNKSFYAYFYLGLALKRSGKLDQSEAALKQANDLSKGKEPRVHYQMALLYTDLRRFNEAAGELELFLKYQSKGSDEEKVKIKQLIQELREKAAKQSQS